jgi:hypothetical protein
LSQGFDVTDAMVTEFRELVEKSKIKIDDADWQKDLPFIKAMIHYEIDLDLFGIEAARKDLVKGDPQLAVCGDPVPGGAAAARHGQGFLYQRAAR